jgi:Mycothiol maleylpyruvate isomerase N-terminal domain
MMDATEMLEHERRDWREIEDLVGSLTPEQIERPGYFPEGWSIKDLIGHLGSWLAEAGVALERMHGATYRPDELDIDAKNEEFLEALRPLTWRESRAQAESARARMLGSLRSLPEITGDAAKWVDKTGPAHYEEHLPRLRAWVGALGSER